MGRAHLVVAVGATASLLLHSNPVTGFTVLWIVICAQVTHAEYRLLVTVFLDAWFIDSTRYVFLARLQSTMLACLTVGGNLLIGMYPGMSCKLI